MLAVLAVNSVGQLYHHVSVGLERDIAEHQKLVKNLVLVGFANIEIVCGNLCS